MSLEEKLAELRQASAAKMPPEVKKIAQRATEDLRNSGILDRVISPGTQMPEWTALRQMLFRESWRPMRRRCCLEIKQTGGIICSNILWKCTKIYTQAI